MRARFQVGQQIDQARCLDREPRHALLPATISLSNRALNRRRRPGHRHASIRQLAYAILDGTLIPIDRVADQKPYYSGKHQRHGVNIQVIADAAGRLVWASAALPGSTHDLTAARAHGMIAAIGGADVRVRPPQQFRHGRLEPVARQTPHEQRIPSSSCSRRRSPRPAPPVKSPTCPPRSGRRGPPGEPDTGPPPPIVSDADSISQQTSIHRPGGRQQRHG
jgi:hypothetical protein